MKQVTRWFLFFLLLPVTGWAETLYVIDKVYVGMRTDLTEGSAVVKTVESGTALEVLERFERFARVREPQGAEGWIDTRYLVPDPPARLRLDKLQSELQTTRAQLTEARTQLKKAEAAATEARAKAKELEQLNATHQAEAKTADDTSSKPVTPPPADVPTPLADGGPSFTLWLAVSFAMLVIGFVVGILWLRESIRKRSGGMYLRV